MRTLAIGDLHGHSRTLLAQLNSTEDRLIFLGDYVDRGPDSRGVLDRLVALAENPNHVFLRGNHNDWMLRARSEKDWFKSWLGLAVGGKPCCVLTKPHHSGGDARFCARRALEISGRNALEALS